LPIRQVKSEIRVVGVDDARFKRGRDKWTRLVGVVCRGGGQVEGCMQTPIRVDGWDATERLVWMVRDSCHFEQLRVVMLRDTIFAGFNIVDLQEAAGETGLPVVAISDRAPEMGRVEKALRHYCPDGWREKLEVLKRCGPVKPVVSRPGRAPVYVQWAGMPFEQVARLVRTVSTHSRIPEPIRIAHLFATSFVPDPEED